MLFYCNSQCFKCSSQALHYLSLHAFHKPFPVLHQTTFSLFLIAIFFLCLYLSLPSAEFMDCVSSLLHSLNQIGHKHEMVLLQADRLFIVLTGILSRFHSFLVSVTRKKLN